MDQPDKLTPTSKVKQKDWEAYEPVCTSLRTMIPHSLWIYSRATFAHPHTSAQRSFKLSSTWIEKACTWFPPESGLQPAFSGDDSLDQRVRKPNLFPGLLHLGGKKGFFWRSCHCQKHPPGGEHGALSRGACADPALWIYCTAGSSQRGSGNQGVVPRGHLVPALPWEKERNSIMLVTSTQCA